MQATGNALERFGIGLQSITRSTSQRGGRIGHRGAWKRNGGVIKHDVAKFVGVYSQVLKLQESGTSLEDVLQQALELYRVKHPKQQGFLYIHCWMILKDVPRWFDSAAKLRARQQVKTPPPQPMKRRREGGDVALTEGEEDEGVGLGIEVVSASKRLQRPTGTKAAKDDLHRAKVKEGTMRAQAKATTDMAAASAEKAAVMQDQAALHLFSIPDDLILNEMARKYVQLWREEELAKIKRRMEIAKGQHCRRRRHCRGRRRRTKFFS